MEVYRPLVDSIVKKGVKDEFDQEAKKSLLNIFNKKVMIKGKRQYLANSIEIYVDSLIKYLGGGRIGRYCLSIHYLRNGDEVNV